MREAIAGANKFASRRLPRIFGCALLAAYTLAPRQSSPRCLPVSIWRYTVALRHPQMPQASAAANKFASRRLLRIFGCALLAAYTVAPRQSSPRCLPVSYLEIYGCLTAPADAASLCSCKQVCIAQASHICHFVFYISKWGGKYFCSALGFFVYLHNRLQYGEDSFFI